MNALATYNFYWFHFYSLIWVVSRVTRRINDLVRNIHAFDYATKSRVLPIQKMRVLHNNKKAIKEIENAKGVVVNDPVTFHNRIFTIQNADAVEAFLNPFIEEVAKTSLK